MQSQPPRVIGHPLFLSKLNQYWAQHMKQSYPENGGMQLLIINETTVEIRGWIIIAHMK